MVLTDPIADMLTRIRNANTVNHEVVEIPASRMKAELAQIMKDEGYIRGFEVTRGDKYDVIKVHMKYGPNKQKVIHGLKRISKPGLRVYVKKDEVPKVLNGLGTAVISTSRGLMTDRQAREAGLGGEVICYMW
ncbi:MAG: 30S ribosomal protein S8 [Bacillota bacterium]|jgi:small subunit ribosomal protein S8|nr:30S ribosomal protein S8 [Bacillota bacterium]HOB42381.1 30S ribosomal protein S8 [Bacillota bacterium]HOK69990.1 30S ribosomal protein S8 [Bacillota bacterium]HOO30382.1 30S ribosomal protein S8 [Bacillota bacterium]HPQ02292.1 30S ribosomal protein S8 [Bacillota bacterium]